MGIKLVVRLARSVHGTKSKHTLTQNPTERTNKLDPLHDRYEYLRNRYFIVIISKINVWIEGTSFFEIVGRVSVIHTLKYIIQRTSIQIISYSIHVNLMYHWTRVCCLVSKENENNYVSAVYYHQSRPLRNWYSVLVPNKGIYLFNYYFMCGGAAAKGTSPNSSHQFLLWRCCFICSWWLFFNLLVYMK